MRRILVDHARAHKAEKRGGQEQRLPLDGALAFTEEKGADLLAMDEALTRLNLRDPRLGRVVELRFFGGLSEEEVAEILNVSTRTVKRDWNVARAWLFKEINRGAGDKQRTPR
jgi:RNA polymerase sigma factor (TIGR02999 family)